MLKMFVYIYNMPRRNSKTLLEKSLDEISYFKHKKLLWQDISFQNLAEESNYSYKQFMKLVRFIKSKKLAKFSASINYPLLGIFTAFMHVCLKNQGEANAFKERVKDLEFIQNIYFIGEKKNTFILRVRALSYEQLTNFVLAVHEKASDLIHFTHTSLIYRTYFGEGLEYEARHHTKQLKLDKIDFEILHLLQRNAHFPLSFIAKQVGLREPTVHRRIKKLKDAGVICGYHLIRKWERISSKYWPTSAICEANTTIGFDYKQILELPSIKNNKIHIRYIYRVFGIYNLLLSFIAKDMLSFRKFVYDELVNVPGILDVKTQHIIGCGNRTLRFYLKE